MIGVQEMLLQTDGDGGKITIFPAWPADKDISFRLHAPHNTTVEATLSGGEVTHLRVTPENRIQDIIIPSAIKYNKK